MLTDRRANILGLVVSEYISTATPVSSRVLANRHGLGVSPATIRNELARLEDEGYITHPHTSAGRVPSDRGYRVYVEALMEEELLGGDEQRTIEHQFHQASGGLDEWLSLGASVLASAVGNLAVVTRPRRHVAHLKHAQLVHLHDASALLVGVMDDGRVEQRMITLAQPTRQDELTKRAELLNAACAESEASTIRAVADSLEDPENARLATAIAELVDEHDRSEDTYLEGMRDVLAQPEFSSADRMLDALRHLGAYELRQVLPRAADVTHGGIRVLIGSENSVEWMSGWSVVVAAYGTSDGASGTLAVLGPTRMQYARTIPRVRYLASLMSDVLHEAGA